MAGGALAATLPGYEARPEQAALAEAVELALLRGEHLVAEAGTGTGKSSRISSRRSSSGQRVVVRDRDQGAPGASSSRRTCRRKRVRSGAR